MKVRRPTSLAFPAVLVLGDSQALGYMLPFGETFAAALARRLRGDPAAARILASPASDVEACLFALRKYGPARAGRPDLAVICVNIANDFDEMYHGGQDGRGEETSALHDWLLRNSYLYMDSVLLMAHHLQAERSPPGVARVLYTLESDERVVMVDETVRVIRQLAGELHAAKDVVVLLVPADYQVDPAEFQKYHRYYAPRQRFEYWASRAAELGEMLNVMEDYLDRRLKAAGLRVLRVDRVIAGRPVRQMFQPTDHHLTAQAHRLITDAIAREVHLAP